MRKKLLHVIVVSIATTISFQVSAQLDPFVNYGWISKTDLPYNVWGVGLASVNTANSSSLFVFGGVSNFTLLDDAHQYDPVADLWSSLSPMNTVEATACAGAVGDKIYMIGGLNFSGYGTALSNTRIYDIGTDNWTNGTPMPTPVADYAFGIYKDSLLYYIGGYDGANYSLVTYDLVQIYDPLTDTWTNGTNIPVSASGWSGGISGNKIVVTGGQYSTDYLIHSETYVGTIDPSNPSNISWEQVDDYPAGTIWRAGAGASLDESSGLVIFTGGDSTGFGYSSSKTFAFDVNSNTWKIGPDKITPARGLRNLTCVVWNDSLYLTAVGNEGDANEWLNLGPYSLGTDVSSANPINFDVSAYPNPFAHSTLLTLNLDKASAVKISIVDVAGKVMQELCDKNFPAGEQQISWNAAAYPAGVYFARVIVNDQTMTEKLMKLK